MILNRLREPMSGSAAILGLKVEGDRLLDSGIRGALIEKVKKGSIADIEGQLRPGDEVIEWNGRILRGATSQEVADVIAESRQDPQVELLVCRPIGPKRQGGSLLWTQGQMHTLSRRPLHVSPTPPQHKDVYETRMRDKPSVRVTSPGSPDIHSSRPSRSKHTSAANANVGGRMQVKLWFDAVALQLAVTLVCAAELTPRSNGEPRNPYAKLFLLPDKSEKSKRRTKTIANTNDPRWNQTFVYCGIRRTDLKLRILEITVWDYVRFGANDFLGEVLLEVNMAPLDEEPTWYHLNTHEELLPSYRRRGEGEMDLDLTPTDHLSPPSTTSRLSDSDASDLEELTRDRRVADGASISSLGSSASPPPEVEMSERRSRRDMSPQGRKRTAIMMSREKQTGHQTHRKNGQLFMSQRSHSAAPTDSPSLHSRSRSKSPRRVGSLSPPENRMYPSHAYVPRFASRSATVTPTGSPKKRHLPQIPSLQHRRALRETTTQDFEERAQYIKQKVAIMQRKHSTGGWDRQYGGLSDSDLPTSDMKMRMRDWLSPDKGFGDSDMESVVSVTSSAFSTQSERPQRLNDFGSSSGVDSGRLTTERRDRSQQRQERTLERGIHGGSRRGQFARSLSNADVPPEEKGDGSLSDTAVGPLHGLERREHGKPSSERGSKVTTPTQFTGMGKKSNSTSQLSATGRKRRLGFGRAGKTSFTVHRSEEVLPEDVRRLAKQGSSMSSDGEGSQDGDSSWAPSLKSSEGGQLSDFIDGLGPGQLVGRQVLGAPSLGDIQLSLCYKKGYLEVEVVRARGLQARPGSKVYPGTILKGNPWPTCLLGGMSNDAPYVKVYLVSGKKCVAKAKTATARRTLSPWYQQPLAFRENPSGCILQVTVWGDYGRIEGKKVFMGAAQIMLDDLDLSNIVIGWYKLFGTTSLVSGPPSLGLSRRSSLASLDSFKL
ncbi:hypothetical protein RUM43_000937 [Polyplax serrata]|uniref:Regulating synaptic membrane exocytosis protein 2 n=1 Tax=Polyplax serrata TaxID=468196 RepID=A0AAN8SE63_POLSC